jgi:hypothetical protein
MGGNKRRHKMTKELIALTLKYNPDIEVCDLVDDLYPDLSMDEKLFMLDQILDYMIDQELFTVEV